ncbi:hypothetical protein [Lactobacillus sp. ESL0246]|uniref:hypothetical protein n=1 Tax=Lactobacillus sp. ESL0246 TaxID=2069359 RepID=UPI0013148F0D|nr:hypothetical protein [Lactobacillus sp. ESL0246]
MVVTESANNQILQQDETLVAILTCLLVVIVYIALNALYQGFCNNRNKQNSIIATYIATSN